MNMFMKGSSREGGTYYFVLGNSGELRYHNLKRSPEMAAGFDTDRDFMLVKSRATSFTSRRSRAPGRSWIPVYSTVRKSNDRDVRARSYLLGACESFLSNSNRFLAVLAQRPYRIQGQSPPCLTACDQTVIG